MQTEDNILSTERADKEIKLGTVDILLRYFYSSIFYSLWILNELLQSKIKTNRKLFPPFFIFNLLSNKSNYSVSFIFVVKRIPVQ